MQSCLLRSAESRSTGHSKLHVRSFLSTERIRHEGLAVILTANQIATPGVGLAFCEVASGQWDPRLEMTVTMTMIRMIRAPSTQFPEQHTRYKDVKLFTYSNHHPCCNHTAGSPCQLPCLVLSSVADQQTTGGLHRGQEPTCERGVCSSGICHGLSRTLNLTEHVPHITHYSVLITAGSATQLSLEDFRCLLPGISPYYSGPPLMWPALPSGRSGHIRGGSLIRGEHLYWHLKPSTRFQQSHITQGGGDLLHRGGCITGRPLYWKVYEKDRKSCECHHRFPYSPSLSSRRDSFQSAEEAVGASGPAHSLIVDPSASGQAQTVFSMTATCMHFADVHSPTFPRFGSWCQLYSLFWFWKRVGQGGGVFWFPTEARKANALVDVQELCTLAGLKINTWPRHMMGIWQSVKPHSHKLQRVTV